MHAIVSVLDDVHYARLVALWQELEVECGLAGIRATPIPHFSWHIAQDYDFPRLSMVLQWITGIAQPFDVHTGGLGLFTRANPVIFYPIVRTGVLTQIQQAIWERVVGLSTNPSPHYTPETWIPHITLAHGDVGAETLCCAIERLAFQTHNWEIRVNNLAVVAQVEDQVGELKYRLPFSG
jgi:2'-5' RNA ligase